MLNYQLEIVEDESVLSIDHDDEFFVNLRFDCSIIIDRYAHIWDDATSMSIVPILTLQFSNMDFSD